MFVFTAKFHKKKAIAAVLVLGAILVAIILIAGSISRNNAKETAALSAVVKNNDQRVSYLNTLGWEVEQTALEEQKVVIPRDFSDVYKEYNALQLSQGFDLTLYGGLEAMRYTYKVINFPGLTDKVVADLLIYKGEVIAGDVQSNALDGFMLGLEYPNETVTDESAADTLESENLPEDATVTDESVADTLESENLPEDEPEPDVKSEEDDEVCDTIIEDTAT